MVRRIGLVRDRNPQRPPMKATAIESPATRIEPADRNAPREVTKNEDGSLTFQTRSGDIITTADPDVQAFAVFVMLSREATK